MVDAAGAVAEAAATADTGADAAAEGSILDGAKAPDKASETTEKAGAAKNADAAGKSADGTAKKAGEEAQNAKTDASKPNGAPEKYEPFKVPDGITLNAKAVEGFQTLAKELNLPQDAAQKLVDFQTTAIKAAQDDQLKTFSDMQKEWAAETRKALGANADKELGFAAQARDKFAPKGSDVNKVLNDSGLANHPEVVKLFISIGKAISEDNFVEGKGDRGGKGEKTAAQIIYPDQK